MKNKKVLPHVGKKGDMFQSRTLLIAIESVLAYFDTFGYPVSAQQVLAFLPMLATYAQVEEALEDLRKTRKVWTDTVVIMGKEIRLYAPLGHISTQKEVEKRFTNARSIVGQHARYFRDLSKLPWIDLAGVSGSCSMDNASDLDDCDVFIMSAPGRMWLARLSAILVAKWYGIHRTWGDVSAQSAKGKICLNLFFDGRERAVPESKRSLYTAHEVVQMLPVVIRGGAYDDFLTANMWVGRMMPQALSAIAKDVGIRRGPSEYISVRPISFHSSVTRVLNVCERTARRIQRVLMHEPTNEYVSDSQLWFFPHDFSRTLRKKIP